MNTSTRWRASWVDGLGRRREYIFDGPASRGVARVDFQLKIVDSGEAVPTTFDLDEVRLQMDGQMTRFPGRCTRQEGDRTDE